MTTLDHPTHEAGASKMFSVDSHLELCFKFLQSSVHAAANDMH